MKTTEILALDATEPDNQRWKALVEQYAKPPLPLKSTAGTKKQSGSRLRCNTAITSKPIGRSARSFPGRSRRNFSKCFSACPNHRHEIYNKMTPFFSIFFDNGFSSEHYGTELHVCEGASCENHIAL